MAEPTGTRGNGRCRGRGCRVGRVVSVMDVVSVWWGGLAAVDEPVGTAEGSLPCTRLVGGIWVALVVEAERRVEGPPLLTAEGSPPKLMPLDRWRGHPCGVGHGAVLRSPPHGRGYREGLRGLLTLRRPWLTAEGLTPWTWSKNRGRGCDCGQGYGTVKGLPMWTRSWDWLLLLLLLSPLLLSMPL